LQDRRSVRIFLTDQGRAHEGQVHRVAQQLNDLLSHLVTPEQLETFHTVLSVLQSVPLQEDPPPSGTG
jgi:DNA-binding MarR family transcriptional regulator